MSCNHPKLFVRGSIFIGVGYLPMQWLLRSFRWECRLPATTMGQGLIFIFWSEVVGF
jgi:hypothetical protein